MSKVRICFLGTPDFAVTSLDALLGDDHFEVIGVVSQPDRPQGRKLALTPSPVKARAVERGLPVITPESLKADSLAVAEIQNWNAEVGVVVAFGQILTEDFMKSFPLGCVNVHASLLPRWRGAAPIQRAIEAGDRETGVALQKMVKKLDAGDVIGERKIILDDQINSLELHDKLALLGADLLRVELMDYVRGNLASVPQNEALVTIAKKIDKSESLIDWSRPAVAIHNKIRALAWGPGSYTLDEGKRLKIHRTRVHGLSGDPGIVLKVGLDSFTVGTGEGALEILDVQPESRSRITAGEFLKSRSIVVCQRLG